MTARRQLLLTVALVAILALGAVAANLALLRSTQDSSDPVGRLSPRAVFSTPGVTTGQGTATAPATTPVTTIDDHGGRSGGHGGEPDD